MRWPLLVCHLIRARLHTVLSFIQGLIFLFIAVEFGFYILIRQMVNAKEWLSACACSLPPGSSLAYADIGRGRKGVLRQRLRSAQTYQVRQKYDFAPPHPSFMNY